MATLSSASAEVSSDSSSDKIHNLVSLTTDISVLLRELAVVVLFVMLFFDPSAFKNLLVGIGISKVETPLGEIDLSQIGGKVSALNQGLSDGLDALKQVQSKLRDPAASGEVQTVIDSLQQLQQPAQEADTDIKSKMVAQQSARSGSAATTELVGWLLCGRVDSSQQQWTGKLPGPIEKAPLPLKVGDILTVTREAYLRADAPPGKRFEAGKILGVVPPPKQVRVVAVPDQYPETVAGTYLVWVKVQEQ